MMRKISVFFVHLACIIYFNLKIVGKENVPKEGAYILCANHKSNWDPPLVVSSIKRKMYVMAKQELFKNKFIHWFGEKCCVFPVKRGKKDLESIKYALKVLKSGEMLMIFPEGTRNGLEKNGKAQNGAAFLALKTGTPVIPVGVKGEFKFRHKVTITYGKPIDFSKYKEDKPEKEILDEVSKEIMDNIIMLTK